jgi:ATP synthase protein I
MTGGRSKKTLNILHEQVGAKVDRKLKMRRENKGIWFGLGMMGLVGWSIALPTLIGTAIGLWLDKHYSDQRSWTLALLLTGLIVGCFTAWSWISKEHKAMDDED